MPIASSSSGTEWQRPSRTQVTEIVELPPPSDGSECPRGLLTVPTPPQVHPPGRRPHAAVPPTASSVSLSACKRKRNLQPATASGICNVLLHVHPSRSFVAIVCRLRPAGPVGSGS